MMWVILHFFCYIDGVYTIIDMATAYGTALGLAGRWHHRAAHQRQRSGLSPDFSEPRECRERGVCHVWLVFVRVLVHRLDAS
jgi:hypothetical protein